MKWATNTVFSTKDGALKQEQYSYDEYPEVLRHWRLQWLTQKDFSFLVLNQNLRPEVAFFDMDSTLILEESLVELARICGVDDEVRSITEQAMAGKIDFEESLKRRLSKFQGQDKSILDNLWEQLNMTPGAADWVRVLESDQIESFLISGGFKDIASRLANNLGLKDLQANEFEFKDHKFTGKLASKIVDTQAKKQWVLAKSAEVMPGGRVCFGDGANDIEMFRACDLAIAVAPQDKNLIEHAHGVLHEQGFGFLNEIAKETMKEKI